MENLLIDDLRKQHFELGMEAMKQGNPKKAYSFFSMAAEKEPLWPEAIFRRAHMAYLNGDKWGAAENAVKALKLEPSLERFFEIEGFNQKFVLSQLNSLACMRISGRNYTSAREFLDSALELNPDYGMALLTMAELYIGMGDLYDALDWLETAVKKAPETAGKIDGYDCYAPLRPYVRYGKIIGKERIVTEEARNLLLLGQDLLERGKGEEAKRKFEEALELEMEWPEALFLLGVAKYRTGPKTGMVTDLLLESGSVEDLARALDYDSQVLRFAPKEISLEVVVSALNDLVCEEYIPKKKFQEAITDLKCCIRILPTDVFPYLTMAEVYVAAGNNEEAIKWLQKTLEVKPGIRGEIGNYACYQPLHSYTAYQELFEEKSGLGKSFYYLEMIAEPGGMREYFQMVSVHTENIRQMMTARMKTGLGFYALLSYGQTIRVHRYQNGKEDMVVDIHPFIKVTVPGKLTASFTEEGQSVITDMEGNPLTDKYVSDLLFDYIAYEEEQETVFMGDWEGKLGALTGDLLSEQEEFFIDGILLTTDRVYEFESGEEYSLEEFVDIAKAGN